MCLGGKWHEQCPWNNEVQDIFSQQSQYETGAVFKFSVVWFWILELWLSFSLIWSEKCCTGSEFDFYKLVANRYITYFAVQVHFFFSHWCFLFLTKQSPHLVAGLCVLQNKKSSLFEHTYSSFCCKSEKLLDLDQAQANELLAHNYCLKILIMQ